MKQPVSTLPSRLPDPVSGKSLFVRPVLEEHSSRQTAVFGHSDLNMEVMMTPAADGLNII